VACSRSAGARLPIGRTMIANSTINTTKANGSAQRKTRPAAARDDVLWDGRGSPNLPNLPAGSAWDTLLVLWASASLQTQALGPAVAGEPVHGLCQNRILGLVERAPPVVLFSKSAS
jgi:hypothetical protein